MTTFRYEDGNGMLTDEYGNEVVEYQMEVDDEQYPLTSVTTFAYYMDTKPPEKTAKVTKAEKNPPKAKETSGEETKARTNRSYRKDDMEKLFQLVFEKGMSVRGAAKELNIPPSTAQTWYTKGTKSLETGEDVQLRKPGSGRPVGRPLKLNAEHKEYITNAIDEKPGIVLEEMMEGLTSQFIDLEISRSNLHKFITTKCNLSLKRAHFQPLERNSDAKIEARFQWVTEILKTDIDYLANCVFIDESSFNINMKRSMAWSKVGETPIVKIPKTRAKSHTIIGAISNLGVVNIQLKIPKVTALQKKKKKKRARWHSSTKTRERERWNCNRTLFQLCR